MKVPFADCVLDADARTVCRGDATINLSPKAFELLTVLIEHRAARSPKSSYSSESGPMFWGSPH